jgi:hypothetical protein
MPKQKKHPMQMTDEEALKHLFHKDIVKAVHHHLEQSEIGKTKERRKQAKTPQVARKRKS